jgi:hypothetical protein
LKNEKIHDKKLADYVFDFQVNHLFHFPMGAGAASLSSIVSEHDDNPNNSNNRNFPDELTADIFK